jgi:hypothetical protein
VFLELKCRVELVHVSIKVSAYYDDGANKVPLVAVSEEDRQPYLLLLFLGVSAV